ncbi:MAG: ArnT family glycosyltransferase [Bryobacteraceae bacterium]
MPTQRRPPMPKLPPLALGRVDSRRKRPYYQLIFLCIFALPLFATHLGLLRLPFFWDELGQFVPTALDLLRDGALVAHSAVPNVHPPGLEAYLALVYRLFGFGIATTRVAMLIVASAGLLVLFLLSIELSRGTKGAPAFLPPILLLASPLFFTQSMLAQLDMPAMVFTLLCLLLFIRKRYALAALATVFLVLIKETGIVVPAVFVIVLLWRRYWKAAFYFAAPFAILGGWLLLLHRGTGYWLGDPGFAHYNVAYALHPVRIAMSLSRRIYYVFLAEFRWVGTLVIVLTLFRNELQIFRRPEWVVTLAVSSCTLVLVSVLGGAELERYLLPVLPIFYIVVSLALSSRRRWVGISATAAITVGLAVNLFWNPPYPFPFENNLAMVDFLRLQQAAAEFAQRSFQGRRIATAWPYSRALRNPEFGFVQHKLTTVETGDFSFRSIAALPPESFDALITYTRTWAPRESVTSIPVIQHFLERYYGWRPEITEEQCSRLDLQAVASWKSRGQQITIYVHRKSPNPNGSFL